MRAHREIADLRRAAARRSSRHRRSRQTSTTAPASGWPSTVETEPVTSMRIALHRARDIVAVLLLGRGLDEERAEHRGLGRAFRHRMVDRIDQHGDAERVRQQDEFLALVVAHVAGAGQELDAVFPFLLGRPDLAHEGMEMTHQRLAHLLDARIGCACDALEHRVGNGGLVEVTHMRLRRSECRARQGRTAVRDACTVAMKSVSPSPCAISEP